MMSLHTFKKWSMSVGLTALLLGGSGCSGPSQSATSETQATSYKQLPFEMEAIRPTSFPDYTRSIVEYGATPDGMTLNTEAINQAIAELHEEGVISELSLKFFGEDISK